MKTLDEGFTYHVEEGKLYQPGVRKTKKGVCFTVAVPDKKRCSLLLYQKGSEEVAASIPMGSSLRYGDIRSLWIEEFPAECYEYNYLIDGQVVTDPYAGCVCGREHWGEPILRPGQIRGKIIAADYDWEGDRQLHIPYEDAVIYAAHVRGFTMHPSSGVRAKGTFAGIQEKIPYLKELGINQLELMPVYDFAETPVRDNQSRQQQSLSIQGEPKLNYWGYTAGYYFAPKASYAATGNPVEEFKDLVKALHRNGIELTLEFYFPGGTNAALILDCIKYWVLEYHIDGVHINRDGAPVEVLAQEPLLSHTKIMTEGFRMDAVYGDKYLPAYRNLAEYQDTFMLSARRFLRGEEGQTREFIRCTERNPGQHGVINYMAGHNGFTLLDLVSYNEKHNEANGEGNRDGTNYNYSWNCGEEGPSRQGLVQRLRARQLRNAFAFLLLAQGTPLIYAGDERGNSQFGNNNAYCQDNETSWVNWRPEESEEFLPEYVKTLLAFRREHPVFHRRKELCMTDYLSCGYPDVSYHGKRSWFGDFEYYSRGTGVMYAGNYIEAESGGSRRDDFFYVAYNMHTTPHTFALPDLPGKKEWRIAIDTGVEGIGGIYAKGKEVKLEGQRILTVPEHTVMVLIGK